MVSLVSVVRQYLRRCGFDIVRYVPEIHHAPNLLNYIVPQIAAGKQGFTVVQIGANDGIRADPIRDLILSLNLRAVLVEPLPDLFASLRRNYSDNANVTFVNAAIDSRDGSRDLYRVNVTAAAVPDCLHGAASFSRQQLLRECRHFGVADAPVESVRVRTITMSTLCSESRIAGIDLLQIDTEGFDWEIIQAAFEAGMFPSIVNFEHVHLSPRIRFDCKRALISHGYQFVEYGMDTVAVRMEEYRDNEAAPGKRYDGACIR